MTLETDNLKRAMRAESPLLKYVTEELASGNRRACEDDIRDLIADLLHLAHLDEKTTGCLSIEDCRNLLDVAFENFRTESEASA